MDTSGSAARVFLLDYLLRVSLKFIKHEEAVGEQPAEVVGS